MQGSDIFALVAINLGRRGELEDAALLESRDDVDEVGRTHDVRLNGPHWIEQARGRMGLRGQVKYTVELMRAEDPQE